MEAKFRLDLSDEEAVHYLQSLIDESVSAMFAAVVEQIHKFAQVRTALVFSYKKHGHLTTYCILDVYFMTFKKV